jgi:hypothetical protein
MKSVLQRGPGESIKERQAKTYLRRPEKFEKIFWLGTEESRLSPAPFLILLRGMSTLTAIL